MHVPLYFLTDTVTVRTWLGASGTGPTYAGDLAARVKVNRARVLSGDRAQTSGSGTQLVARLDQDRVFVPESQVLLEGRTLRVTRVTRHADGGHGVWQHLLIDCE
jgi:hypothetical protein